MLFDELKDVAYVMQDAYRDTKDLVSAIEEVEYKYPKIGLDVLWAMWFAIDAYVKINVNTNTE